MRCDALLYLIPEVITNPKKDIIYPKNDIMKNAPNSKANILIPPHLQRLNMPHIAAVQNITTLQISRPFAYHHAENRSMNINTANHSFNENIISNPPLKSVS